MSPVVAIRICRFVRSVSFHRFVGADAYIGQTLGTTCHASVGHDDLGVPSVPAPNGAWLRVVTRVNPPPFSFWRAKKKMAVEPSKEKTLVAAQLRARSALPRSGTRR